MELLLRVEKEKLSDQNKLPQGLYKSSFIFYLLLTSQFTVFVLLANFVVTNIVFRCR